MTKIRKKAKSKKKKIIIDLNDVVETIEYNHQLIKFLNIFLNLVIALNFLILNWVESYRILLLGAHSFKKKGTSI